MLAAFHEAFEAEQAVAGVTGRRVSGALLGMALTYLAIQ